MGDDYLAHAAVAGRTHERKDFVAAEVAGSQNHVMFGDQVNAGERLIRNRALVVDGRNGGGGDTGSGQFPLDLRPEGELVTVDFGAAGGFVGCVDGRHPDERTTAAAGDLHDDGVEATNAVVEGNGATHVDAGHGFGNNFGAFHSGQIVRLEDETAHAMAEKFVSEVDVIDSALDDVGRDMHMKVVSTFERGPCLIGHY